MKITRNILKTTIKRIILENQNMRELKVIDLLSSSWEAPDIRMALNLGETAGMFKIEMDHDFDHYTKFIIKYPTPEFKAAFNYAVNRENEKNDTVTQIRTLQGYTPHDFLGGKYGQGMMSSRGEDRFVITSVSDFDRQ